MTRAGGRSAPASSIWISGPWIDLLVGCGGWSVPLLLVAYTLVDRDVPRWSAAFYALALVCNYPHYMATIYRAYGRGDRASHRMYTHYLTAALVVLGIAAHVRFALVPWLFTAYVMWSPWHYTGQNFGLLMMFLRRAGIDVSAEERRRLRLGFVASYVMLLAAFNDGPSRDPLVFSLGLPALAARIVEAGAAAVFVAGVASAFVPIGRRARAGALLGPITLASTQALWFVAPVAAGWIVALPVPQTRYSSGMLAVMHSAQYLWITRYFAKRDADRGAARGPWRAWAYGATLVAGGIALFLPVPWIASWFGHADFTVSMIVVASIVNLHHFMIDGVVWKLRHPRVSQVLVTGAEPAAAAVGPTPPGGRPAPATAVPARVVAWRIAAAAALVALAAIDQWRYLLTVGTTDRRALETATWLNPHDSSAFVRLADADRTGGDLGSAEAALRQAMRANPGNPAPARALEQERLEANRLPDAYALCQAMAARWPDDADTLVNAGVLAYRLGDAPAAERWWTRALARDATRARVHLYVAELLDGEGRTSDALPYYRRYLEIVAAAGAGGRPAPREVASIVVKFADALARDGDRETARSQYDLAIRMAHQTGLGDVLALAMAGEAALAR